MPLHDYLGAAGKYLLKLGTGVAIFVALTGEANGQSYRKKIIYPRQDGVAVIDQRDGRSTATFHRNPFYGRPPVYTVVPDRHDPYRGNIIHQREARSTARQYDLRPEAIAKQIEMRARLFRNRNRVIRIP